MSANLCVAAHMRDLIEDGFEVAIAKDATAGAVLPKGDAYEVAPLNSRMIASSVRTTDETVCGSNVVWGSRWTIELYLANDARILFDASVHAFTAASINPNEPLNPCVMPGYSV